MFQKTTAAFLAIVFMTMFTAPLSSIASEQKEEMNLTEFLKTNDEVTVSYSYPSMKLADNGEGKSTLSANTPVIIQAKDTITTKNMTSGSTVNFSVLQDIKNSNGNVLIKAGTPVSAQISFMEHRGIIGQSGEITISDFHTTAIDGTYIPLSGTVSANPNDKTALSIVLSVLVCPLFLFMRGKEATITAGTTKTAYTLVETYIKTAMY